MGKYKETITEIEKRNILRQNSAESNAITRECIESALILLMKEKPFEEISIQDIIRKAGVGRSSYYRNYDSKEAILEKFLDNIILETSRALVKFDVATEGVKAWMTALDFARTHADEYRMLLDAGFGDKILRRFIASYNNNPDNLEEIHITNTYLAGCIYAVMTQWILDGMKTDERKVAELCNSLMFDGLRELNPCVVDD